MLATKLAAEITPELSLPGEASTWTGQTGLVSLVLDAVQSVAWPGKGKNFAGEGESFRTEMLMTLLTYCYATGVYCSHDIERSLYEDPVVRYLCANDFPGWKTLRRFRQQHRDALKQSLINVFRQSFRIRFGDGSTEQPLADHCVALALDRWFEPLCVPHPISEADERLNRACFLDGMAMVD